MLDREANKRLQRGKQRSPGACGQGQDRPQLSFDEVGAPLGLDERIQQRVQHGFFLRGGLSPQDTLMRGLGEIREPHLLAKHD